MGRPLTPIAAACLLGVAALLTGCDPVKKTAAPRLSVEERATQGFEGIVKEVKRRLSLREASQTSIGGGPSIDWSTEVVDELYPPESEGLAWRAKVTVVTKSSVTVISMPEADEEEDEKPSKRRRDDDIDGFGETGNAELDSVLGDLPTGDRPATGGNSSMMRVIDGDKTEVFDLIFEDGSWRATDPIDEETLMGLIMLMSIQAQ